MAVGPKYRGNKHMEQKTEVKLLGFNIDDRLLWNSYIDQRVIKIARVMAAIRPKKCILIFLIKHLIQVLGLSH